MIAIAHKLQKKPMFLLILALILLILKEQSLSALDLYTDISITKTYASFLSHRYDESLSWKTLFPKQFQSDRWAAIEDQLRSFKNWYGMSAQDMFYYTLAPIILSIGFNFVECLEFVISRKNDHVIFKKLRILVKVMVMMGFPVWPIVILILEAVHVMLNRFELSEASEAVRRLEKLYGRAQLIEVLAEAGIQPFFQVFVVLRSPAFFAATSASVGETPKLQLDFDIMDLVKQPQFQSTLISMGAIALTYTKNYKKRWEGKMSLKASLIYFLHVTLGVVSRIAAVNFFALAFLYKKRENPFVYIFLGIGIHVAIVVTFNIILKKKPQSDDEDQQKWFMKAPSILKDVLLDGLATIHVP